MLPIDADAVLELHCNYQPNAGIMQLHASFFCIKALIEKGWSAEPEICPHSLMLKSLWACHSNASPGSLFSICQSNDTLSYNKTLIPRALKYCPLCSVALWLTGWILEQRAATYVDGYKWLNDELNTLCLKFLSCCSAVATNLWCRHSITLIFTSCNLTWTVGKASQPASGLVWGISGWFGFSDAESKITHPLLDTK